MSCEAQCVPNFVRVNKTGVTVQIEQAQYKSWTRQVRPAKQGRGTNRVRPCMKTI